MRTRDKQLGKPGVLYTDTLSNLGGLSAPEGSIAFASDQSSPHTFDGADWNELGAAGGLPDLMWVGTPNNTGVSSSARAWKGMRWLPKIDLYCYGIRLYGTFTNGRTIKMGIFPLSDWVIQADNKTPGFVVSGAKVIANVTDFFETPVLMEAGTDYWIGGGYTSAAATTALEVAWPDPGYSTPTLGIIYSYHGIYSGLYMVSTNPGVGDTVSYVATNGWISMAALVRENIP